MSQIKSHSPQKCVLLAILCGDIAEKRETLACQAPGEKRLRPSYPFPKLVSSGRLDVHTLNNPSVEQFIEAQQEVQPGFLYIQGQQLENEEIGTIIWGDTDLSDPEMFVKLLNPPFPTKVYLEVPIGEKLAQSLHSKGIPYVIYWRNSFSSYAASHFRHAFMSVIQSSCSHTVDAFQLARASFRIYCVRNDHVQSVNLGPCLLGDTPKTNPIVPADNDVNEEEEGCSEGFLAIRIHDEYVNTKFLVCGVPRTLDADLLGALEDGLKALLNIEIRGSELQKRVSEGESLSDGVVTMRCHITTCSSSYVSFRVSGSDRTCFDNQLLQSLIKNEIIENSRLVRALSNSEDKKQSSYEPLASMCIACGASTFEVLMTMPKWAAQVLKHFAQEISYRSLVALGIACVNGTPVSSFDRQDVDRLLFFCSDQQCKDKAIQNGQDFHLPRLSAFLTKDHRMSQSSLKPRLKPATMRPIPRTR